MEDYNSFKSAGRLERDYDSPVSSKASKPKTKEVFARFEVDAKSFPYLHDKSIGDDCEILVKVKKVSESMPHQFSTDKDNSITLEILKIAEPKSSDTYKELADEGEKKYKMDKE